MLGVSPGLYGSCRYPILWVATTGNDTTGTGSPSAPYATIAKAATVASAGTTIMVRPGTYSNVYMLDPATKSGTTAAPIRIVSQVRWGAKIVVAGSDYAWYMGDEGSLHPDHYRIIGFEITAPNAKTGILVDASDVWVIDCHVYNVGNNTGLASDGAGINLNGYYSGGYTGTNNRAIANWVHHIGHSTSNQRHGVYVASPSGWAYNNVVYDIGGSPNGGWGIHFYHAPNGGKIVNNTIFNCQGSGAIVFGDGYDLNPAVPTTSGFVANNIIRDCTKAMSEAGSQIAGVQWRNNAVFNCTTTDDTWDHDITGTVTSNPSMVNYLSNGTGDYRLNGGPCVGTGTATNAPAYDYDGVGHGSTPSIGAFR